jgi:hypothetical protein
VTELWEEILCLCASHFDLLLVLIQVCSYLEFDLTLNFETNRVPLADTIRLGTSCKQTLLDTYNSASCGPEYVVVTGIK